MIQDVHFIKMINENLILLFFNVAFLKRKIHVSFTIEVLLSLEKTFDNI